MYHNKNITSPYKETRDPAKLAFTKECLCYNQVDYSEFLYITPNIPVFRCLDDNLSHFIETRLECEQFVHPLRETANKGKFLIFLHKGTTYLIKKSEIKHKAYKTWVGEDSRVHTDTYSYTSELLEIKLLIDE